MSIKPSHNNHVKTSNGFIVGHEAPNASNVIEYLGIPYAQPPIEDLRFAAPVAFEGDAKSIFNASEFVIPLIENPLYPISKLTFRGVVSVYAACSSLYNKITDHYFRGCPVAVSSPASRPYPEATDQFGRIVAAFTGSIDKKRSEDCLTLNIWSKNTPNKSKPVIVFFHGGSMFTIIQLPLYPWLSSKATLIVSSLQDTPPAPPIPLSTTGNTSPPPKT